MGNRDWLYQVPSLVEQKNKVDFDALSIPDMSISVFSGMDLSFEVYSDVLGYSVWFCSNEDMALDVISDEPEAITYTTNELIEIINLNPGSEALKTIHEAKSIFPSSKLIDSQINDLGQ